MKPRKVMINLEVLTNVPISVLRDKKAWKVRPFNSNTKIVLHQVTAQVVKRDK